MAKSKQKPRPLLYKIKFDHKERKIVPVDLNTIYTLMSVDEQKKMIIF